jgi:hypothetical protein
MTFSPGGPCGKPFASSIPGGGLVSASWAGNGRTEVEAHVGSLKHLLEAEEEARPAPAKCEAEHRRVTQRLFLPATWGSRSVQQPPREN